MAGNPLMRCPPQLRAVQHYLKLAVDYETRQPIITYWARLYSLESALKIDRNSTEARTLLAGLMDWLETFKKAHTEDESITSNVAGQALMENEANKLFEWADGNDRAAVFNKNVVKSFYTCGVILDVCEVFGEMSEEVSAQRKYAKWKATYIHNCLKNGEQPVPGPIGGEEEFGGAATSEDGLPVPPQSSDVPPAAAGGYPAGGAGYSEFPTSQPQQPSLPIVDAPSPAHHSNTPAADAASSQSGSGIPPANLKQARKYCKWADSALDYEDVSNAVDNLTKALALLQPLV